MEPKLRLMVIRLLNQTDGHPEYTARLGIEVSLTSPKKESEKQNHKNP